MTNQSGRARPARGSAPSGGRPSGTARYTATMWIGGMTVLVGVYLILISFTSHSTRLNWGVALVLVGGLAGLAGAIIRSIVRNRGQRQR